MPCFGTLAGQLLRNSCFTWHWQFRARSRLFALEIVLLSLLLLSGAVASVLAMYPDAYQKPQFLKLPTIVFALLVGLVCFQLMMPVDTRMVMPALDAHGMKCAICIASLSLTPQAIIQGKSDVVGSNASGLASALSNATKGGTWIAAKLEVADKKVDFSLPETANINAKLLLVGYQKQSSNPVPRGENAGTQLTHRNSVTAIIPLGDWHGAALNLTKELPSGDGVALLIQSSATGEIIGAAWR